MELLGLRVGLPLLEILLDPLSRVFGDLDFVILSAIVSGGCVSSRYDVEVFELWGFDLHLSNGSNVAI